MRSSNPVLTRQGTFSRVSAAPPATPGGWSRDSARDAEFDQLERAYGAPAYTTPARMTVDDVVVRTATLLGIIFTTGAGAWLLNAGMGVALAALVAALGCYVVILFKKVTSPSLIMAYAAFEGVLLGSVSHAYNTAFGGGIVVQAVLGTATAFAGMLVAYKSGKLRVTPKFTKIVVGATIGFLGLAVVNLVASFLTPGGLGLRDGGALAILFSIAGIVLASLFLALDFDLVDRLIAQGAPEREAWLASFALTVTLVWLYLEILRLLSYFRD